MASVESSYSDIHPSVSSLVVKRVMDFKDGYKQNLAILGRPRSGKTTLLRFVEQQARLDGRVVPVYLSVHGADPDTLLRQMMDGLAGDGGGGSHAPDLWPSFERRCPHTMDLARRVKVLSHKGKTCEFIRSLMMLPEVFTAETKTPVAVLWDDFDEIQCWGTEKIFQEFGRGLMTQKRCLCIVTSSKVGAARKILSEKLSLLFGHFETLTLEPVPVTDGRRWIMERLKPCVVSVEIADFIVDFCGGSIWAMDECTKALRGRARELGVQEIKHPILTDALADLLGAEDSPLKLTFQSWTDGILAREGWEAVALLECLAEGRLDEQNDVLRERCSLSRLRRLCDELQRSGYVWRNGRWRLLADPLFGFWLKHVWRNRHRASSVLKTDLIRVLSARLQTFHRQYNRDWSSLIADLLSCFSEDSVVLQGRRYRLSDVQDIASMKWKQEPGSTVDVLKIKTNRGMWWVVLEADRLKEGDVSRLLKEAGRDQPKARRIVLISTQGLDDQVRLKALEDNLWIWQERHLRDLALLFQRPLIVKGG